ncbi:hypothetical protein BV22DRAFT_389638 [Leucogyrophana mollusca]|uniref:Uncharacterized protein n=1 Tax=Leucogyrophana mollusca TaxID=85980 RepID=A0ACB8BKF9_9AGAM|nr:hypothetical protein BV22DRAFT_389638 [Leucogyrophana mollusca]
MDQDSFRQLLQQAPRGASSNGSSSIPKVARAPKASSKAYAHCVMGSSTTLTLHRKAPKADEPAFKPRKLKKNELKYRDRAAERRDGGGNDYAEVEAVLEDFEKRTAKEDKDAVDEQRRYLGGDSEHSILVKGLDMALLEQNKARAVASTDDDETLEQAFIQVTSEPTVSKKRTREDIIRELKEKRQIGAGPQAATSVAKAPEDEARVLEEAKKAGKFRPIGFKPIGSQKDAKGKKKRAKEGDKDGERKKKRRKEEHITNNQPSGSGMQDNIRRPRMTTLTYLLELESTRGLMLAKTMNLTLKLVRASAIQTSLPRTSTRRSRPCRRNVAGLRQMRKSLNSRLHHSPIQTMRRLRESLSQVLHLWPMKTRSRSSLFVSNRSSLPLCPQYEISLPWITRLRFKKRGKPGRRRRRKRKEGRKTMIDVCGSTCLRRPTLLYI